VISDRWGTAIGFEGAGIEAAGNCRGQRFEIHVFGRLEQALEALFRCYPGYVWEPTDRVILVAPLSPTGGSVLDRRIVDFDVRDGTMRDVLAALHRLYDPRFRFNVHPLELGGTRFREFAAVEQQRRTLRVRGGTVRDVLEAASVEFGAVSWWVEARNGTCTRIGFWKGWRKGWMIVLGSLGSQPQR
jgi:hypothetical protein